MKKAFTLVELLVVIAVIGVLAALLMPALSSVKIASSRAISAHSLHQLAIAGESYLGDHNYYFWKYSQSSPGGMTWWFGWESTASMSMPEGQRTCDYSQGPLGPYAIASDGIKTDPAFLQYSPRLKPKYQDGNYGYGYNTLLPADPTTGQPRNLFEVQSLNNTVVFATCAQVNTFESPASPGNPMIEEFYMINATEVTVHFRHGGKALAAFLDGSVREMEMCPGTLDTRLPSANIGRFAPIGSTEYLW